MFKVLENSWTDVSKSEQQQRIKVPYLPLDALSYFLPTYNDENRII